ncbi:MAG: sugar transferase [Candidatus Paceibacterota bacterium]|jgi:lipopolysaccharide/colanic/teichoic acid biosynthesis glycosyltransferase
MQFGSKKGSMTLLLGDIFLFIVALWLTLVSRSFELPNWEIFSFNLVPFLFVFATWVLVFFIADLYGKQAMLFRRRLPQTILNALLVNSGLAIAFFYFLPYFGVTPKTILFIDLFWSFILIFAWRRFVVNYLLKGRSERIYFACQGQEVEELKHEIKNNPQYNSTIMDGEISDLNKSRVTIVVINPYDSNEGSVKDFYKLIFRGVRFLAVDDLYEEVFERVPLSLIDERWFLENITNSPKMVYDSLKRVIDFILAFILSIITLPIYPIVWVLMKIFDPGPMFSFQKRVGQNNRVARLSKFRTMTNADDGGHWGTEKKNEVTKLGAILRKTRLDEIPQSWNVLWGNVSLVGPRPEFPEPVRDYSEAIPFYSVRHLVKPGLSGWAQVYQENHPHHGIDINETRNKLSYDLYYIKNRSLWLDISIALKTIKILILSKGK